MTFVEHLRARFLAGTFLRKTTIGFLERLSVALDPIEHIGYKDQVYISHVFLFHIERPLAN